MIEPDSFGLGPLATLAHVAPSALSPGHALYWGSWTEGLYARRPALLPVRSPDPTDPGATHEFESWRHVRIGVRLIEPAGGRLARAGALILHDADHVPPFDDDATQWADLAEQDVTVMLLRVRGMAGSRQDLPVWPADQPWLTIGLEAPVEDPRAGTGWILEGAVADVANAIRALRRHLGRDVRSGRAPVYLYGEGLGAGLALVAHSQLSREDQTDRMALATPMLADWDWTLPRVQVGPMHDVRDFITRVPWLEERIETTLRYFDAALHARRVRCPVLCRLALRDEVAPAPAAAAAYNALGTAPGRKWRFVTRYGHFDGGVVESRRQETFLRLLRRFFDPAVELYHDMDTAVDEALAAWGIGDGTAGAA